MLTAEGAEVKISGSLEARVYGAVDKTKGSLQSDISVCLQNENIAHLTLSFILD